MERLSRISRLDILLKGILVAVLAVFTVRLIGGAPPIIIDSFDLVMHEAGHTLLGIFGEFVSFAGGTIFQVGIPLALLIYFFLKAKYFAAGLMVWWVGENLVDIGIYMADARGQMLTLLGGEHDWLYIFGKTGLLQLDEIIGGITQSVGSGLMVVAVVFSLWFLWESTKNDYKNS